MSNIFKISGEYLNLVRILTENEGELTPEIENALAINKAELEEKGLNYGFVIKSLESDIDVIDLEVKRLQALKKVRQTAIDRLKSTLKDAMELYEISEIKSPIIKINFRKSESTEILDESLIDKEYMVEKITRTPDKTKIKDAIKSGLTVNGAIVQTNYNIQIK